MLVDQVRGEVDHCRHRLMKYCRGQGLDLGCGNSKIRVDAIGIDIYNPNADMNTDARLLDQYSNNHFDYVFSSHLLEELDNTEAVLKEWLRVLKDRGYLVLYQADKDLYYPIGDPQCNGAHKHHFSWESLWAILEKIPGTKLIHHSLHPETKEWSFELVIQKNGTDQENALTEFEGISFLIPTLNRPQGMEQFAVSVDKTTNHPQNIEIVFGVHAEDQASIQKASELKQKLRIDIRSEIIERYQDKQIHLSFLWNQIYQKAKGPIVGYFGDDVIFHTPGWDDEVRKEFLADKAILVCCNDVHVQKGKIATLFFTHKLVHDKFGFYLDMRFRRWYNDTFWDSVFRHAGKLHYREDLIAEHLHPDKFPDKADMVYKNMEHFKDIDGNLWRTPEIQNEIIAKAAVLKEMKF